MDKKIDYDRMGKLTIEREIAYIRYDETHGNTELMQWLRSATALQKAIDEEMDKVWIIYGMMGV